MESDPFIRILAVDDEPDMEELIRQQFRRKIRKQEMEFVFAQNGVEALLRLSEYEDIDLILSDINMPEMDGLTLLNELSELKRPSLKTIMVSAYGDMDNIRTAMNRGAFDFVMKPINFEDLEITINKTLEQIVQIRNARKEHDQLASIQYDLNVAREIQTAILPKDFPAFPDKSEFDLYAAMNAAKSVGGDFYDFFMIDDDKLGLAIADVSGKGIPAALFMAVSRTMLKANALGDLTPNECLQRTNDNLCLENVNTMFVTVFYAILNIRTGELSFANAGHNAPYILRNSGEVQQMKSKGELVLGAMEGTNYSLSVETLNPGESFYLYTDGVSEAMNRDFDLYGEDRLEKLLKTSYADPPRDLIMKVVKDVNDFVDDAEQSDDITALAVKYLGA